MNLRTYVKNLEVGVLLACIEDYNKLEENGVIDECKLREVCREANEQIFGNTIFFPMLAEIVMKEIYRLFAMRYIDYVY